MLPSLQILFNDSFLLLKKSFFSLLILSIITWVLFIILVVGLVVALIPVGIFGFLHANSYTALSNVSAIAPITIFLIFLVSLLVVLGIVLVSSCMQVAFILVVDGKEDAFGFGEILRKSIRLIIPAGIVLLYVSSITIGSFFLFIIPSILFSILLSFSLYEVVLEGKRGNEALRSSIAIVTTHFWAITLRIFCLFLINLALLYIVPLALQSIFPNQQFAIGSFSSLVNVGVAWYSLCYTMTLYKQAKAVTPATKTTSVKWLYFTAIIGWIIGVLVAVGVVYAVSQLIASKGAQEFFQKQIEERYNDFPLPTDASLRYDYRGIKEL